MFKFLIPLLFVIICTRITAQQWVSTQPENRKALIEEFTGVQCGGCSWGDAKAEHLLQVYGNDLCVIGCHQPNTLFCVPYGNDPDFRRAFLAAIASPSFDFIGIYPTGFVNRTMWPGETHRNIFYDDWEQHIQTIIAQPSPVNIGIHPVYDATSSILAIDVEVYYTSTVTDSLNLFVEFTESGIVATQKIDTFLDTNYIHKHVFREALCAQWGDPLSTTTQGNLFTTNYSFNNQSMQYNMPNCEVIVFVTKATTGEVVTANRSIVNITTGIPNTITRDVFVYPNPFENHVTIKSKVSDIIRIFDATGVEKTDEVSRVRNTDETILDFSSLTGNMFYIRRNEKIFKIIR